MVLSMHCQRSPFDMFCSSRNMILLIGCILIVNIDVFVTALSSSSSNPLGPTSRNIATQILQGTGTALIDLNQYNIPFEEAQEEWTAKYVQKTNEKKAQVFLRPKSETTLYADTVVIRCPRKERLGLELTELASRDDGLGITIITGLVAGGSAEQAEEAIFPGDSLAEVAVIRQKRSLAQGLEETESVEAIRTECLSYDATVDALASLPSPRNDGEEFYKLTVKRLRRKPKVTLKLQYPPSQNEPDTTIELFAGENLRYGMLLRGIKLNDPLAKRFDTKSSGNCGAGGLCTTCAVSVVQGNELLNPQRPAEKQMLQNNPRWRLSCKAIVGYGMQEGNLTIRVNPRQWD